MRPRSVRGRRERSRARVGRRTHRAARVPRLPEAARVQRVQRSPIAISAIAARRLRATASVRRLRLTSVSRATRLARARRSGSSRFRSRTTREVLLRTCLRSSRRSGTAPHCLPARACCVSMGFRGPVCNAAFCSSVLALLSPTRTFRMSSHSVIMRGILVSRASRLVARARTLRIRATATGGISWRAAKTPIWSCARPSAELHLARKNMPVCT